MSLRPLCCRQLSVTVPVCFLITNQSDISMSNTKHFFFWTPLQVRPKYEIYTCTPKQDEEHPCLFHVGVGLSKLELTLLITCLINQFVLICFEFIFDSKAWGNTLEKCITVYSSLNFKVFFFLLFPSIPLPKYICMDFVLLIVIH